MKSKNIKIVYKDIKDLTEYENNSREHSPRQIEQIVNSINEYGFCKPLMIDENNQIIAGHGRLLAANRCGLKELPCIVLDGLSEEKQKAFVILDNKLPMNASWNKEKLKNEIIDFDEALLELIGFDLDEIDELFIDDSIFEEDMQELAEELDDREIPKMERQLNEHNDYIVFVFTNSMDFIGAVDFLKIKKIDASISPKTKKIGIGRVLKSDKLMDLINEKNNSI